MYPLHARTQVLCVAVLIVDVVIVAAKYGCCEAATHSRAACRWESMTCLLASFLLLKLYFVSGIVPGPVNHFIMMPKANNLMSIHGKTHSPTKLRGVQLGLF